MSRIRPLLLAPVILLTASAPQTRAPRFQITFPAERSAQTLDGRLLLIISTDSAGEPRSQVNDDANTAQIFGVDVEGWLPGRPVTIDAAVYGYPLVSLADIRPGRYRVQALLNRYETFRRADGHVVKLPPDKGEGQQWASKPGNLYSTPQWVRIDATSAASVQLSLEREIPPIADPPETKYVKHVRLKSERLSRFWGRDMYLGAHVLLPEGFDTHPNARYPLVINHGHFPYRMP